MSKIAIIDIGTNTFNLLIASVNGDKSYEILHSGKLPVKLGEGGINQKLILPEAYQRGLNAIGEHYRTILLHGATKVFAFATSATRNASNGSDFINDIKNLFGVDVKIIDGDEEALLIYLGVRQAVSLNENNVIILDIGGGSNEIAIGNSHSCHWRQSYNLGISRLLQQFNPSDPIKPQEIKEIENYIEAEIADLHEPIETYQPTMIIGSSGSFDTYRSILTHANILGPNGNPSVEIPIEEYFKLHNHLISTNKGDRDKIPGMDPMRVEMIVLATIFTHYLIRRYGISVMMQSAYSLKEGAVWRLINEGT